MSKAYKCDRCGKLFEPYKKNSNSLHVTRNPNFSNDCLDLCPKCNTELQEWVANDTVQVDCNCVDEVDKEIKVGDEVLVDERCMIVLGIDSGKWKHLWCPSNGFTYSNILTSEMTKTGRHFDIQSMFEQMRNE